MTSRPLFHLSGAGALALCRNLGAGRYQEQSGQFCGSNNFTEE